jgi:hypothetical protein
MSRRSIDDIDDVINTVIGTKASMPAPEIKVNQNKNDNIIFPDKCIVYFKNYESFYRAEIVSIETTKILGIDHAGYSSGNDRFDVKTVNGLKPIYLTKKARKDVARSLKLMKRNDFDYVIPFSFKSNAMNKGIIYCTGFWMTDQSACIAFLSNGHDPVEKAQIIYSYDPSIGQRKKDDEHVNNVDQEIECGKCKNAIIDNDEKLFTCNAKIFTTWKQTGNLNVKIFCDNNVPGEPVAGKIENDATREW